MAAAHASRFAKNLSSARNTDALLSQLRDQFDQGATVANLPFTTLANLGTEGVKHLTQRIEADLLTKFKIEINMTTNLATFTPLVSPEVETKTPARILSAAEKRKIPRPPNAFIIYRTELHPTMVAKHPELQNVQISRLIGDMWRSEDADLKKKYAQKADDAKRQHAIAHPGYHYQPRKPHEKKRRMTKKKVAALKGQAEVAPTLAPTIQIERYKNTPTASFESGPDPADTLGEQIKYFNMANNYNPATRTSRAFCMVSDGLAGGQLCSEMPFLSEPCPPMSFHNGINPPDDGAPPQIRPVGDEYTRQTHLLGELDSLFDFDAFTEGNTPAQAGITASSASDAIEQFSHNYQFQNNGELFE